jgi:hypothetical protein
VGAQHNRRGSAGDLHDRLADLDAAVAALLGGPGSACGSARELWHRGAGEVQVGLSLMTRLAANGAGHV